MRVSQRQRRLVHMTPSPMRAPSTCWQERALGLIPNCSLGASPESWFSRQRCHGSEQKIQELAMGRLSGLCPAWLGLVSYLAVCRVVV